MSLDVNCDGTFSVADVVLLSNLVLGLSIDPTQDANGNGCPDKCESYQLTLRHGQFAGASEGGQLLLVNLPESQPTIGSSSTGSIEIQTANP